MEKINIFISHSITKDNQGDYDLTMEFYNHLKANIKGRNLDIELFFDHEMRQNNDWKKQIIAEINKTSIGLLLISPSFFASDFCKFEYEALKTKAIIPVLLKNVDIRSFWNGVISENHTGMKLHYGDLKITPPHGKNTTDEVALEVVIKDKNEYVNMFYDRIVAKIIGDKTRKNRLMQTLGELIRELDAEEAKAEK